MITFTILVLAVFWFLTGYFAYTALEDQAYYFAIDFLILWVLTTVAMWCQIILLINY